MSKTLMKNFNLIFSIAWFLVSLGFGTNFTINGTIDLLLMSLMSFGISVFYFLTWLVNDGYKNKK